MAKRKTEAQHRRDLEILVNDIEAADAGLIAVIERNLGARVWGGTTVADRLEHQAAKIESDLLQQMQQALISQDSYDDFVKRMEGHLGLDADDGRPQGPLRDLLNVVTTEGRLAWNSALVSKQLEKQAMMVPVWRAVLDDRTTPGCWRRHGRLINEELSGDTPPRHYGCRCDVLMVPDPGAPRTQTNYDGLSQEYQDWAELGRQVLADMRRDREASPPVAKEPKGLKESMPWLGRRSRFDIFRIAS